MKRVLAFALVGVFSFSPLLHAEIREWTRASDGKKISAEYVGMKDEATVQIKMANGNQFEVPLTGLSAADREFIKTLNGKKEMVSAEGGDKPAAIPEGETTVTLSGVHLCCSGCKDAIVEISEDEKLKVDPAVKFDVDSGEGTVTITAPSGTAAKTAVNAVFKVGYYGVSDHTTIKIADLKEDEFTSDTMRIQDLHLCCRKCVKAFEKAVKSVDGVKEHNAKEGITSIQVTGEGYNTYEVMKALREAGFGGTFR